MNSPLTGPSALVLSCLVQSGTLTFVLDRFQTDPAAVVRTAMKAVGVDMPLGKVTAEVPKLRA